MFEWFTSRFDPTIDYTGQSLSEKCMYTIFILGYTLSFVSGIVLGDLKYTLYGAIGTFLVSFLVIVPAWPFLRRNPVKFMEVVKHKED